MSRDAAPEAPGVLYEAPGASMSDDRPPTIQLTLTPKDEKRLRLAVEHLAERLPGFAFDRAAVALSALRRGLDALEREHSAPEPELPTLTDKERIDELVSLYPKKRAPPSPVEKILGANKKQAKRQPGTSAAREAVDVIKAQRKSA